MSNSYQWISFYEAFADELLEYESRRTELYNIIESLAQEEPYMGYLKFEDEEYWGTANRQIDPFTLFGIFNRGITNDNRRALIKALKKSFCYRI